MTRRRSTPESVAPAREARAEVTDVAVVLEAAARFLEARARSVAEVRGRLGRAGYPTPLVDEAVGRLLELGVLDDRAFAEAWVESRDRARPRGESALRRELSLKGIDRTVTDDVLGERRDRPGDGDAPSADEVAAGRLLARHARALERVADPRARRQRAYALLARNGFDPEIAGRLARSVPAPAGGDEEPDAD